MAPLSLQEVKAGRPMKPAIALSARDSGALPEMFAAVSAAAPAAPAARRRTAFALLNNPRRKRDSGAWAPPLGLWSTIDGAGLAHFAENDGA